MSHVDNVQLHIKSLKELQAACDQIGLVLHENVKTYKWYGTHVGDYPLPKGFKKEDMGHCDHMISVKGAGLSTYQVGVCKRRDGLPGYLLQYDFYAGGHGLVTAIGQGASKIKQEYAVAVATAKLRAKRFQVRRTVNDQGKVILRATR